MKSILFVFFHFVFFLFGLLIFPLGYLFFLGAVSNNCCDGPFLSVVLLIGAFIFMIVGALFGWLISFIFAEKALKMTEAEVRKVLKSIAKRGSQDSNIYNWCINFAYKKNT